jgi:hypothetical protein
MNRFSPLIVRQARQPARPFAQWEIPAAEPSQSRLVDDVQLFATSFAGGLVFFGTFLL